MCLTKFVQIILTYFIAGQICFLMYFNGTNLEKFIFQILGCIKSFYFIIMKIHKVMVKLSAKTAFNKF